MIDKSLVIWCTRSHGDSIRLFYRKRVLGDFKLNERTFSNSALVWNVKNNSQISECPDKEATLYSANQNMVAQIHDRAYSTFLKPRRKLSLLSELQTPHVNFSLEPIIGMSK